MPVQILSASDSSLLVRFGETVSPELHQRVLALFRAFLAKRDERIRNLHPAYASLLIDFDPLRMTHAELAAHARELIELAPAAAITPSRLIIIPVCYDPEFGLDLEAVAAHHHLSVAEVIRLHTSATYLVYFLGFSPGFAYLGGLPQTLRTPRLVTPRTRVSAGSIGIAGDQTGVYPVDSPGGWQLIGRTPVRMFDASANPPTRLEPGDQVRFSAIDRSAFEKSLSAL